MIPIGTSDGFPMGQCTWWADFRYHQLTGKFIPWAGDAWRWLTGAQSSQWATSASPPRGIPSIIILQPNVQGAGSLGHVAVVERVNPDGSVVTSNQNWGLTPAQRASTQTVTFTPGPGVSFAWYPGATGNNTSYPTGSTSNTTSSSGTPTSSSSSDWQTQFHQEGIKIGIFLLALVLCGFGLYMLFQKQADGLIKKGVDAAKLAVMA